MDCKTAGLLLPFLNPRAERLPGELAEAVEAHVNQCAICTSSLQNMGREDRVVAVAMKDVEIPDGLHDRLIDRLRLERLRRRTWPMRHPRWSAAAAVLMLCIGGAFGYWWQRPMPVDMDAFVEYSDQAGYQEQADNLLAGRHIVRPHFLRYSLLISSALERFQGKLAPRLTFEGNAGQIAEVYILTSRDFDLGATTESSAGSGNFTIELIRDSNVVYLVRYSGGPLDWLFVKDNQGA